MGWRAFRWLFSGFETGVIVLQPLQVLLGKFRKRSGINPKSESTATGCKVTTTGIVFIAMINSEI